MEDIGLENKQSVAKQREFKILSIDGGGVRGLLPLTLLCSIEEKVGERIWKYFDLITGTSTGGIIALWLSTGRPPGDLQKLYDELICEVFPRRLRPIRIFCPGFLYDSHKLESFLKKEFNNSGQDLKMKDAKTRVCIPSIDITCGKVVVYKTPHSVIKPNEITYYADANKEMWKVALATSAAPIFFKPAIVENSYCVDGGLWANNPSLVGVVEAMKLGYSANEISVFSLGTGESILQVEQNKAKKMNWSHYLLQLVELSFQSQSQSTENQMRSLLENKNYIRAQHKFQNPIGLDDINRLADLKAAGQSLYREQGDEIIRRFFSKLAEDSYIKGKANVN